MIDCSRSHTDIIRPSSTSKRGKSYKTKLNDCNPDDLHTYKAHRWIWNEAQQLRSRYISFDLNALIQVAEEAAGDDAVCINVTKLPEGNFNKVFLVTMRNGKEVVVKIPDLNAGLGGYGVVSEVATMKYARKNLDLLVPRVLSYPSRVDRGKLCAEYIVMEKVRGVELGRVWKGLKGGEKLSV